MAESPKKSDRNTVRRIPRRANYDPAVIYSILDEGIICHVAIADGEQPFVLPMTYSRIGNRIYLHGAKASRLLRELASGARACIEVTLVDGLVLARSAFHHSMNYRSAIVFGSGQEVEDPAEKLDALRMILERLVPGRWQEIRPPSEQELRQTQVVAVTIDEASAKIRTGPPLDDAEDYALAIWAGVLPLSVEAGSPVPDAKLAAGIPAPDHLSQHLWSS